MLFDIIFVDGLHEKQQVKKDILNSIKFLKDGGTIICHDVNLIDVIEYIVDGAMAGMARSGKYRKEEIPKGLLEKAFNNTIELLLSEIVIEK